MSKELDIQAKIRSSVKRDGGYCHKLTNRFTIGIPDLLIGLFPFIPCLGEVKDLGEVTEYFNRQLDVTPKQSHELNSLNNVYEKQQQPYTPYRRASLILVAIKHVGSHRLVALPPATERLSYEYMADDACYVERAVGGYYDVKRLLDAAGIMKIGAMP